MIQDSHCHCWIVQVELNIKAREDVAVLLPVDCKPFIHKFYRIGHTLESKKILLAQFCSLLIELQQLIDLTKVSQLPALGREVNRYLHRMFCSLHLAVCIYGLNHEQRQ